MKELFHDETSCYYSEMANRTAEGQTELRVMDHKQNAAILQGSGPW